MSKVITPHVRRRAAKLAKQIQKFARRDPQTGQTFYFVPSQEQIPFEPVRAYKVDLRGRACSCPAFWNRGICSHSLAAQIATPSE